MPSESHGFERISEVAIETTIPKGLNVIRRSFIKDYHDAEGIEIFYQDTFDRFAVGIATNHYIYKHGMPSASYKRKKEVFSSRHSATIPKGMNVDRNHCKRFMTMLQASNILSGYIRPLRGRHCHKSLYL